MRRFLLSAGLLISAFSLSIAASSHGDLTSATPLTSNPSTSATVKQLAPGVTLSTLNGKKRLNVIGQDYHNALASTHPLAASKAAVPDGYVLFESFEDWDGDDVNWTPEGWTVESKGEASHDESWLPSAQGRWDPAVPDGKYYYSITYGDGQDEWFMSPFVDIADGMELSYWLYFDPVFLYVIDSDHIDWATGKFKGDPEVAATLQIWAQAEGEDWTMLRDYAEEYKDYSYSELSSLASDALAKNYVALDDFYGKKTRVAFRYVGTDGNEMFIDAIAIGYPTIDNVSYTGPSDIQYWGLTRSPFMVAHSDAVGMYPVYYPITWENESVSPKIDYTWTYSDPETGEIVTSNDPYELTVTYKPDYTSDETSRCNLYSSPILRAEAKNCAPTEFQAPYAYIQAGGRPKDITVDGTADAVTMFPYNLQEYGLGMMTLDDYVIGGMSIPVFGYDGANTDQYWLNYSLNGQEDEIEGDYSHLIAIANLIYPLNDAPLVVHGANVYGYGQISDDAELTITIRSIIRDQPENISYEVMDIVASKTIKGTEILRQDDSKGYMCIPFDFDEPVVLRASDESGEIMAYFVMFEGFRSDKVTYFAPLQSKISNPDGLCQGYIVNHINLENHVDRPPYYSTKTMRYAEDGDIKLFYGAFAIGIDAEYPWLTTDCKEIALPADGGVVDVVLGSYYDGADLTVVAPAGVKATVNGRYNKCVLSVSLDGSANIVSGDIVVKGPGVEVTIPVSSSTSGIEEITSDTEVRAVYDLTGRRVVDADAAPGVYVVKYADGAIRKLVVK